MSNTLRAIMQGDLNLTKKGKPMTTTPQDALTKIRHQIHIVETYIETNPDWLTPRELIHELRAREKALANEIQIRAFEKATCDILTKQGSGSVECP
jgi:hypothetical protein